MRFTTDTLPRPPAWIAWLLVVVLLFSIAALAEWRSSSDGLSTFAWLPWLAFALVSCAAMVLALRLRACQLRQREIRIVVDELSRLQNLLYILAVRVADAMASDRPAGFGRRERELMLGIVSGDAGSFLIQQRSLTASPSASDGRHAPWRLFFPFLDKISTAADLREQAYELVGLLDLLESVDERQVVEFVHQRGQADRLMRVGATIRSDASLRILKTRAAQAPARLDRDAERFMASVDTHELESELAYLGEDSLERRVYDSARRQAQENPELKVVLASVVDRILQGRRARQALFADAGSNGAVQAPSSR
jgi:hypothetical protein